MAEVAHSAQHEFWRPPMVTTGTTGHADRVEACDRCGTEFIVDSRFCHTCGAGRADLNASTFSRLQEKVTVAQLIGLGDSLGLNTAAFIAFAAGVLCLLGALGVGVIFNARTMADWQAVQLWRIEWLLAALAAFVAGCLLKNTSKL
jgi:ribosomal protein L37E